MSGVALPPLDPDYEKRRNAIERARSADFIRLIVAEQMRREGWGGGNGLRARLLNTTAFTDPALV